MRLCYSLEIFKTKQNEYASGKQLYKSSSFAHIDVTCSPTPSPLPTGLNSIHSIEERRFQ